MKKLFLVLAVVVAAGFLFALTLGPRPDNVPASSTTTIEEKKASPSSQENRKSLPEVVTLFQKGDGESDLALFVASELEKQAGQVARFKNIDVARDPEVAAFYGVNSIPSVIIKTAGGRVLIKHEGYMDSDAILNALRAAGKN
ncbi:MAG: thioredoxin family protein [bacterium]